MNVNDLKTAMQLKAGRTNLYLRKHSPEILLGAGLVGMVATVVMASKATLRAGNVLAEHDTQLDMVDRALTEKPESYSNEDATKDKVTIHVQTGLKFAKLYGPSLGLGVLSVAAILASHGVMANRQVALVAAYNLLSEGFKNYRQRVVEELGEEKDRQYRLGLREEEYETESEIHVNEDGTIEVRQNKKKKQKQTKLVPTGNMPSIYARCFDNSNPMYRADRLLNRAFLTAQERYINDLLILRGYVFLNEAYERLGFPHTSEGQLVGWVLRSPEQMKEEKRDGYVSFGLEDSNANREFMRGENDAIWLDFNVDGIVYNLI